MTMEKPDHHDAELLLKVYDLRRESVMRESRDNMNAKFWPKSYDDILAVEKIEHPLNCALRQTRTYWEMVYGLARHGIVNADYWIENNSEGLFLYAKYLPFLDRVRKEISPTAFRSAEWISTQCAEGRRSFEIIKGRVRKQMESR